MLLSLSFCEMFYLIYAHASHGLHSWLKTGGLSQNKLSWGLFQRGSLITAKAEPLTAVLFSTSVWVSLQLHRMWNSGYSQLILTCQINNWPTAVHAQYRRGCDPSADIYSIWILLICLVLCEAGSVRNQRAATASVFIWIVTPEDLQLVNLTVDFLSANKANIGNWSDSNLLQRKRKSQTPMQILPRLQSDDLCTHANGHCNPGFFLN